ncbi:MAG: MFS transporter [Microbacteriaceae bacterium]|nr:MFS transporter [Microbacteriaceae bacterium]
MHESATPGTTTRGSVAPQGGPTVTSPTSEINTKRRALALSVLLIPAALTLFSVTSVNVAMPAVRDALGADAVAQALILTTYTLAFAVVLLPAGQLGDQYGHKRVFIIGVTVFTLANVWCGLAPDFAQLVAGRVLSGMGAGITMTPVAALIQLLYAGPERARPFGLLGAVLGAGSAVGPLLGGMLIQAGGDIGWRLLFLINVPFGIAAIVLAIVLLPANPPRAAKGFDLVGVLLFTGALVGITLPFSMGSALQPGNLAMLATGIVLFVLFVWWGRRRDRRGQFTAVAPRVLAGRALRTGMVVSFLGFGAFTSSFLFLALLWQDALGHGAFEAGLVVLPFAIGSTIGAAYSGRLVKRFGARVVTVGLTMMVVGLITVGLMVLANNAALLTLITTALPLLVIGLGVGLFVGPLTTASFTETEGRDAGVASAMLTSSQRCGTAVGIGLLAALYASLPGGSQSLSGQAIIAFVTAAFALAALLVMAFRRPSGMDQLGA